MVDFSASCSVWALVAMVTILYLKKQNIVIQVILGYWKRLIFFFFLCRLPPQVWWGKQCILSLAGQLH